MNSDPIAIDYLIPGVRVEVFDQTAPIRLRVRTPAEMVGWTPFVADPVDDLSRQVATTVKYGDALYAISSREETAMGWLYDLIPWPEGEMPRRIYELSAEAMAHREQERSERLRERRHGQIVSSLGILIGLLPSSIQGTIGELYDYDARRWAFVSSALTALIGLSQLITDAFFGAPGVRGLIGAYLFFDGAVRFAGALVGEVYGLLLVELLYFLARALWRSLWR